uniref:Uncharacterized protein n=1 Tax=Branchiostoma floridae TaxID=7739 RepID=C3ZA94_BRAFL|eukprot:XP_002594476.1 hypothetical protein BRAFLDRAFT_87665 [Branchiostoma floridae]
MAKPMSPVWLIAMVICLSFTFVKADGFKKKEAFEEAADDVGKWTFRGSWDAMENYLDTLGTVWDIAKEGYEFYSEVSPEYEKWEKGEISREEFLLKFGKAGVKSTCSVTGSYVGATLGVGVPIPGGSLVGSFIGSKIGEMVCDAVIEE